MFEICDVFCAVSAPREYGADWRTYQFFQDTCNNGKVGVPYYLTNQRGATITFEMLTSCGINERHDASIFYARLFFHIVSFTTNARHY